MRRDEATLVDIVIACRLLIEFAGDLDRAGFFADAKTQSAVLHQLLVVGEAVKRLSSEFTRMHASIPWPEIAGMRDRLVNGYDAIDLDEVWNTVERDVPRLLGDVEPLTPRETP